MQLVFYKLQELKIMFSIQWCSQGQNVKAKAKAWTFEAKAKAWTFEAKAFKHTARAETNIHSTSDKSGHELNFDCFCLDCYLLFNYV